MDKSTLKNRVAAIMPDVVKLRRAIHARPELSGEEFATAKLVRDTLCAWGINAQYHLAKTAVSAKITSGKGPVVVLRADTDALPITEENDVAYASKNIGVMHACGHDMHTAALLGAAKILHGAKNFWRGTVLFLFQPSEELDPGGAFELIKAGVFPKNAAAVFGLHVSADHKCGTVAIKEGCDYADVFDFEAEIFGRGGHGASPEKSVDPIVCASTIILQLQTLISREISPHDPAVLTVGKFHAGTGKNIIPARAAFGGTVRAHSKIAREKLMRRIREVILTTAKSFGAKAAVTVKQSYPSGYNDVGLARKFGASMAEYVGAKNVITRTAPSMYAEDFARYQQLVKGLYIYLGVSPKGARDCEELHSAKFLPDESALEIGVAAHVKFVTSMLGG